MRKSGGVLGDEDGGEGRAFDLGLTFEDGGGFDTDLLDAENMRRTGGRGFMLEARFEWGS